MASFYLKKKVNGLQPGFAGSTRWVGRVMTFPIFSLTRLDSSPGSTRRAGPGLKNTIIVL
jgi:hypothetical protein